MRGRSPLACLGKLFYRLVLRYIISFTEYVDKAQNVTYIAFIWHVDNFQSKLLREMTHELFVFLCPIHICTYVINRATLQLYTYICYSNVEAQEAVDTVPPMKNADYAILRCKQNSVTAWFLWFCSQMAQQLTTAFIFLWSMQSVICLIQHYILQIASKSQCPDHFVDTCLCSLA